MRASTGTMTRPDAFASRQAVRKLARRWAETTAVALSRVVAGFRRLRQERITRRELALLDDHLLRDIGLSRGDIPYAARYVAAAPREALTERPLASDVTEWAGTPRQVNRKASRQQARAA